MTEFGRVAVTGAASVLLTVSGTALVHASAAEGPAPATSAAAHCSGKSCAGKSPSRTGCDRHARTVRRRREPGPTLGLRYSPGCRAAWARVTHARPGDRIDARTKGGGACHHRSCYARKVAMGRTSTHTAMVDDKGLTAWACLWRTRGSVCTEAYRRRRAAAGTLNAT